MIPKAEALTVSFNATWVKNWEPFYISRRNVPMFDERFKQYGFGMCFYDRSHTRMSSENRC